MSNVKTSGLEPTSITAQSGSTYTLALGDAKTQILFSSNSIVQVTIPPSSSVSFSVPTAIECVLTGAKALQFIAGAGVTINSLSSYTCVRPQYNGARLFETATDTWLLTGIDSPLSSLKGWILGGITSAFATSKVWYMTYSTGVVSSATQTLLDNQSTGAGLSDTVAYGYAVDGSVAARIVFSTGVISQCPTMIPGQPWINEAVGISSGSAYGYFCGGLISDVITDVTLVTFSTAIASANAYTLTTGKHGAAGVSDGTSTGYICGGGTTTGATSPSTSIETIVFSTGVVAASTATLPSSRLYAAGISDNLTYGYILGGASSTLGNRTSVARITFSTGTVSTNTSSLTVARRNSMGLSDGAINGYAVGGGTSSGIPVATTDKIVFSSGTISAQTTSNISPVAMAGSCFTDFAVV